MRAISLFYSILFVLIVGPHFNGDGQLPFGFQLSEFSTEVQAPSAIEFGPDGRIYICDFSGKVWLHYNGEILEEPIIDISEEVAGYGELGCLGFALHPGFAQNGFVYMLYVTDRHHLMNFGTEDYDPNANEYNAASQGRLTRFQLDILDYQSLIPDSRTVLFGEEIGEGCPSVSNSHGTGDIEFGEDGTLLASLGDGNTFLDFFAGGDQEIPSFCFDPQALDDGIMRPEENVGSFRAQQVNSYSGKVIRIDPLTGEGIPSNPFYDANDPDAARSKVWALGLRNPYRMSVRPGTGSSDPADGNPGTLYISDVGYNQWEEINVCDGPGYNFGWPIFEGNGYQSGFSSKIRMNRFIENPLAGEECDREYFSFQELISQENEFHEYRYPNPCESESDISDFARVFAHTRPAFAWRNSVNEYANPVIPGFNGDGDAVGIDYTSDQSPVENATGFAGIAGFVGDFYTGDSFPEEYDACLPVMDFSGWLKLLWFNENGELEKVDHWLDEGQQNNEMKFNPYDGCYYIIEIYTSTIRQLCFTGNLRPIIEVSPDPAYGTSPLEVQFDTDGTYDPEGAPLTFSWDFGDGSTSDELSPTHTFTAPDNDPYTLETVLTVSDTAGNVTTKNILVSMNNSPPQVDITSIDDGELYHMDGEVTMYSLVANVVDGEHSNSELEFVWNTFMHHNTHFHAVSDDDQENSQFTLSPVGCEELDTHYYRVQLEVTDPEGLTAIDQVFLYPDCDGLLDPRPLGETFEELVIYPNPNSGLFSIGYDSELWGRQLLNVDIYDLQGRRILSSSIRMDPFADEIRLDLQSLPQGEYIIHVKGDNIEYTDRFMIQKS